MLDALLESTGPQHPVVVVDGRSPRSVAAAFDRAAATDRVRVVRRPRFLASNEARNLGVDAAGTDWIAFVENDVVLSAGWLDALLAMAEAQDAATAYPAYLVPTPRGPVVHGIGSDLAVTGPPGARRVEERQVELGRLWNEIADDLAPASRVQAEPHALVTRREVLERMSGLDEGLLSWFDHTDFALHHQRLGVSAWFVPTVTCTYRPPPPISLIDLPSFALRWGKDWYERSLDRLCTAWSLDRSDPEWHRHERYRVWARRSILTRWATFNAVVDHATAPVDRLLSRRWDAAVRAS